MIARDTPFSSASNTVEATLATCLTDELDEARTIRQWANAFEFGANGMVIADSITNRFTACNQAFARITGRRPEEIVGLDVHAVFDPTERARVDQFVLEAESLGHVSYQTWVLRPGEESVPVQVDTVAIRGNDGLPSYRVGTVRDITASKQAEAALRIAATAFESQVGMAITDEQKVILRVNRSFTEITGYTSDEAVGQTPRLLNSGRHDQAFFSAMWEEIARTGAWQGEIWNRRKSGEVYPEWLTIAAVKDDAGVTTNYVATFTDITSRKAADDQIRTLAFYDALTGLPNRRLLMDRLEQSLAIGTRHKRKGALLFVDLDNFKVVNDAVGYHKGDRLLAQVAKRLTSCVREGDTVARLGGDEFVVMLEDVSEFDIEAATQAEIAGAKILASLSQAYQMGSYEHRGTASVGITLFGGNTAESADELLKRADLAMYQAKAAGRNALRFFEPQMQTVVTARAAMEADLWVALEQGQFALYYQAQVSREDKITGAEALVRWNHPRRGLVPPGEFIPLAEETGLILQLGQWVMDAACAQLALWADQPEMAHLTVAVNVSARQLHQPNFVNLVLAALKRSGADPKRLKLELTESTLVSDAEDIIAKMTLLKACGVGFSLDDFGTGYSSLSYLSRLPLDQLKIDRSFVMEIESNESAISICAATISLAHSLKLKVVAEGVETEAQQYFLSTVHRCDSMQGYLFSRPLPLQEFELFAQRI